MMREPHEVTDHLERQLLSLLTRREIWGSPEAVCLQALLLIDLHCYARGKASGYMRKEWLNFSIVKGLDPRPLHEQASPARMYILLAEFAVSLGVDYHLARPEAP